MKFNYRCSKRSCRKRHSLPRELAWYILAPRCPACGSRLTLDPCNPRKPEQLELDLGDNHGN